jgi:hypothetical protein
MKWISRAIAYEEMEGIQIVQDRNQWWAVVNTVLDIIIL